MQIEKKVGSDVDYGFDWDRKTLVSEPGTGWLGLDGDTIASSTWSISPSASGATIHDEDFDIHTTVCWVDGGIMGLTYILTNDIVTAAGRKWSDTHELVMVEK